MINYQKTKKQPKASRLRSGFSTLPTVLFLGGLIVEIILAVSFILSTLSTTNLSAKLSAEAFAVAESGLEDAIIKVVRSKDCPPIGCASSYDLNVGTRVAGVTICKDVCSGSGTTQIDSIGTAQSRKKKIRAVLTVDASSGLVSSSVITEIDI